MKNSTFEDKVTTICGVIMLLAVAAFAAGLVLFYHPNTYSSQSNNIEKTKPITTSNKVLSNGNINNKADF